MKERIEGEHLKLNLIVYFFCTKKRLGEREKERKIERGGGVRPEWRVKESSIENAQYIKCTYTSLINKYRLGLS